ncbi:hypothetical protein KQI65_04925 [bacterium]|nr:hypothetical protein [bacterium]
MTLRRNQYISLQLSLYLDGQLGENERREVEELIATDSAVREEYEQLQRMHSMLAAREPLPPNPFLPEKIMNHIRREAEEQDGALPVPRRYLPAAAALAVVLLVAVGTLAWLQRDGLMRYVEDTGTQMQEAYENSVLKGWIMPLFERTDRDDVLQFAMFGTLPLDEKDGTILRVDEHADSGYRVELARDLSGGARKASLEELYEEIRPTADQRRVFDTLFSYAQRQIESSVLMNDDNEIAIDPAISKYHKVILSGIAASLEPEQLERFDAFLSQRNTPYTFVSHASSQSPPQPRPSHVIERFRTVRMPEEFVVLMRDSITFQRLQLNMDSLRRLMKGMEHHMPRFDVRVNELARTVAVGNGRGETLLPQQSMRVTTRGDDRGDHVITIAIQANAHVIREMENEMRQLSREVGVFKREQARMLYEALESGNAKHSRHRGIEVEVRPDGGMRMSVNMDSIMNGMLNELENMQLELNFEQMQLFSNDSTSRMRWYHYNQKGEPVMIDSLMREHERQFERMPRNLRLEIEREIRRQRPPDGLIPPDTPVPPESPMPSDAPMPSIEDTRPFIPIPTPPDAPVPGHSPATEIDSTRTR